MKKEAGHSNFWWPPLIGIAFPVLMMVLDFFPVFTDATDIYVDDMGTLAQSKTIYQLAAMRPGTIVLLSFLCLTWLLFIILFILASFIPKFRGFRLFNILFDPLLIVNIGLTLLLFNLIMKDINAADYAYREAQEIDGLGGYSVYYFTSIYFWLDMLLPAFIAMWWIASCLIAAFRNKREKNDPLGEEEERGK